MMRESDRFKPVRDFYDHNYYAGIESKSRSSSWHYRVIADRLGDLRGKRVLDVACGLGEWLDQMHKRGARISGIDISTRAVEQCCARFSEGDFRQGVAEDLPFADGSFDLVTCLGSLEHFLDKPRALAEMVRVAAPGAHFLILVPNAGFLTRRLGLYDGTQQVQVREDVYTLGVWAALFNDAGLVVEQRWRDLHMLNFSWITRGAVWMWPARAIQAAVMPLWPIHWQYQVHHLCRRAHEV